MRAFVAFPLLCLVVPLPAARADESPARKVVARADQRFASVETSDVPDFQKHVVPLLGRLGCNGRNCHGSFQGRGGFRLSLFGYDFRMDHDALTARSASTSTSRINRSSPPDSLIIRKPSLQVDHEGGERFDLDSWQHHLVRRWIESGAEGVDSPRELTRLEIQPPEVVFTADVETTELRVVAHWEDGSREDVTPLCRFRANDDSVVTVDSDGRIKSVGAGDSHVVAFYDNGVASAAVMRSVSGKIANQPAATTKIDQLVQAKLRKLGVVPSPLCTDAEFLRRLSIDVTGTLPTPDEVEAFLADDSNDKRQSKIDELLSRGAYAAWWTNKLCDLTGCNPTQQAELGQETAVQWYMWIYRRVQENVPYDKIVARIATAVGREQGQSFDDYCGQLSAHYRDSTGESFADRETMPHYWTRRTLAKPEDKAMAFAHSFLGLRLQCAQCHKHPFAPWTQHDFKQFASFFDNIEYGVQPESDKRYRELAKQVGLNLRGKQGSPVRRDVLARARDGKTVPWRELHIRPRSGSTELSLLRSGIVNVGDHADPRGPIMAWMVEKDNPWFARAFVNRVWASYFHVGLVDPPDDLNPANPPSNPELLDWLTTGFIDHDYDMKWVHRTIVASHAYQRSWRPNETNRQDRRNFSRAVPRRIPAEVVYDGVKQAVAASDRLDQVRTDLTRRASGHLSMRLAGTYAMRVFGKPDRAINCDCERVNQPTLLQSVFLQNDPLIDQRLAESGWIGEIAEMEAADEEVDHAELVRLAWLRTVSHPPSARQLQRATEHLAAAPSLRLGMRDLLWALLNTKEFVLNR